MDIQEVSEPVGKKELRRYKIPQARREKNLESFLKRLGLRIDLKEKESARRPYELMREGSLLVIRGGPTPEEAVRLLEESRERRAAQLRASTK